jgi:hypothetical protein
LMTGEKVGDALREGGETARVVAGFDEVCIHLNPFYSTPRVVPVNRFFGDTCPPLSSPLFFGGLGGWWILQDFYLPVIVL